MGNIELWGTQKYGNIRTELWENGAVGTWICPKHDLVTAGFPAGTASSQNFAWAEFPLGYIVIVS